MSYVTSMRCLMPTKSWNYQASSRQAFWPDSGMLSQNPCEGCIVYPVYISDGCVGCMDGLENALTVWAAEIQYWQLLTEARFGLRVAGEFGP